MPEGMSYDTLAIVPENGPASFEGKASLPQTFGQILVPDILSYIFMLCLPEVLLLDPKKDEAPMNISQVCRTWRSIALSTLQLWTQFQVTIHPREQSMEEHAHPILKEWLKRSGTADVRISINCIKAEIEKQQGNGMFIPDNGFKAEHTSLLLSELEQHWGRIKGLTLILPDDHLFASIEFIYTKLLALDTLSLRYFRAWRQIRHPPALDERFSRLFNNIKELSMDSEVTFQLRSEGHPACPKLKKLSLLHYSVSAENAVKFLSGCPQLEEFNFSPPNTSGWGITPLPAFNPNILATTLSSLRVLDISATGQYMYIIGSFLDRLDLPQLKKLTLTFGEDWPFSGTQTWPHLVHFLSRSRPPLESLVFVKDWMSDDEVVRCLELLPSLRRLETRFSEEMADALYYPAPAEGQRTKAKLCPMLQSIKFNDISDLSKAADMVRGMIASRKAINPRITMSAAS